VALVKRKFLPLREENPDSLEVYSVYKQNPPKIIFPTLDPSRNKTKLKKKILKPWSIFKDEIQKRGD